MRFDQLQAGSDDDGPIAQSPVGPVGVPVVTTGDGAETGGAGAGSALVRVEMSPPSSQTPRIDGIELPQAPAGDLPGHEDSTNGAGGVSQPAAIERNGSAIIATPGEQGSSTPATPVDHTSSVAVADKPPVAIGPAVLAVSEIIRTAADQAAATWKVAGVPAQRRESPVAPFQAAAPPAVADGPVRPLQAPAAEPVFEPESAQPESVEPGAAEPAAATATGADDGGAGTHTAPAPKSGYEDHHHWPSARRQISLLVRVVCVLVLAVLLGHRYLPDVMGFGSLIDTFLPWTFVPLLLAVPGALLSLDKWAVGVAVLACGVWGGDFGPQLVRSGGSGPADLRILSQNVSSPPDLTAVANLAGQREADIVVLQGLTARDAQVADESVPERFPYHLAIYEFVVWSRYPLVNGSMPMDLVSHPVDEAQDAATLPGSTSGQFGGLLRFTVQLDPARSATVFAVHLPQPSLSHDGFGVARGDALQQLVAAVRAEKEPNLVVVGDLDLAQTDRGMRSLVNASTGLVSVQAKAGAGFGFTWPSGFPMVRLDDVLTRGLTPVRSVVLPAVGSRQAHRPIEADLRFATSTASTAGAAQP